MIAAGDVVVYAFSSSNFRRTVMIAWKSLLCPTSRSSSEYLASTARNVQPSTRPHSANNHNRNSTMVNVSPPNGTKSTQNKVEGGALSGGRRNIRLLSLSLDDGEVGRPLIAVDNAPSSIKRKQMSDKSKERVETVKLDGGRVRRQHDAENATSSLLLPYHSPTVVETISIRHSNVI